jgi:hypothetical protein
METVKRRISGNEKTSSSSSPSSSFSETQAPPSHQQSRTAGEQHQQHLPLKDYITTQQFESLGQQTKSGYMSFHKTNTLIPRWKKKYFILGGNYLRRYSSPEAIEEDENNYKEYILTASSLVQHTDSDLCFILKTPTQPGTGTGTGTEEEFVSWMLKTETAEEAKEWIVCLSSHIHCLFLQSRPDLASTSGSTQRQLLKTFWMLPHSNSAGPVTNPVGIRSLPDQHGPRTGDGIYPGEIFEVVQQIPSSHVTYLGLADDRGWVFDKHPTGGYDLIVQLQPKDYQYEERVTALTVKEEVRELSLSLCLSLSRSLCLSLSLSLCLYLCLSLCLCLSLSPSISVCRCLSLLTFL